MIYLYNINVKKMVQRFMGKKPFKKFVRPARNIVIQETVKNGEQETDIKNNELNDSDNMSDERLARVEKLVNAKAPKRKVKVEKKDKGLIERTENSTILLTEDNKMMLND